MSVNRYFCNHLGLLSLLVRNKNLVANYSNHESKIDISKSPKIFQNLIIDQIDLIQLNFLHQSHFENIFRCKECRFFFWFSFTRQFDSTKRAHPWSHECRIIVVLPNIYGNAFVWVFWWVSAHMYVCVCVCSALVVCIERMLERK